ncbi:major facilitator superfamily transporter [Amniculicola lignicola CBS 123094]|uniref:Major facilitator superfamily transporter n=1 Tax=Amniculicola lignicola CBS 123094 TaxID=1392246 RepID=A0A6A5WTT4_9PLEO|nr:major facilitator superfamily transporter [Amniculicola lignicola CBS 123094]
MSKATVPEEEPLLASLPVVENGFQKSTDLLEFDHDNPKNWPNAYKWAIVFLLALMAFTVTFTCISIVPLAGGIVKELEHGAPNPSASTLLVTIWELGEAVGPLLIAPLSEVIGRYPVMNGCNVLFVVATIFAGLSRSTSALIAMRAFTGAAVASNVLNPAIIGDMFEAEHRGSAMSMVMFAPLVGGAVGPAIGGLVAQTFGWRSVLFIGAGLAFICEVLFLTCFRETYAVAILRKRSREVRQNCVEYPVDGTEDHGDMEELWLSITRPAAVLFSSWVLLILSLFGAVQFSYFYVMSITMADILQNMYGFSPALTGTAFLSFSIGSTIGVFICHTTLDRIYIKLRGGQKAGIPEYRLPLSIIGAVFLPLSIVAYGWVAQLHLPVALLLLMVAFMGLTLLITVIPLSAYVVDACGAYSASALTGVIVTRCLMGTFLPLTVNPLTHRFGYGWGFTCIGMGSLILAPIPALIMRYGQKWRQRCEYTRSA